MDKLLAVNVGLPREIAWRGGKVHTSVWKHPLSDGVLADGERPISACKPSERPDAVGQGPAGICPPTDTGRASVPPLPETRHTKPSARDAATTAALRRGWRGGQSKTISGPPLQYKIASGLSLHFEWGDSYNPKLLSQMA